MALQRVATIVFCICAALGPAWSSMVSPPAFAQVPAGAAATAGDDQFTADELQRLVAPIALYPDPLIAIILPASTFPLDVVQAARFIDRRARDPNTQPSASWNESVRALLNYPEVVKQLNDDLDWTNDLGLAVAGQQPDVLDAIQRYRRMAAAAGNLRSDERQRVEQTAETVAIEPTDPERVYVPQYDPQVVVVQQPSPPPMGYYPTPYPNYAYPYPPGYAFTGFATGLLIGGLTTAWAMDWNNGSINNNVNINRQANISGSRTQVSGGQRWQAQRPTGGAGGNTQLRPANRGQGVQPPGPAGGRDPGQPGARQRPGDPQFGRERPQQVAAGRPGGEGPRPGGAAGTGGPRPQVARPAQQPSRDAFANQGSRQVAQRDAQRGQVSRSGGGARPAATQRSAPAGGGAARGGARGGRR